VLKIKGKIVQSTEIGMKSIKIIYFMYHCTLQLVVFTMIYARKTQKDGRKVFVSSLSSHYLYWTRIIKKDDASLLSLKKRTMFFAVIGKEDNVSCCRWKKDKVF